MTTSQAPVVWWRVTEITTDNYVTTYDYHHYTNAVEFIQNNPDMNLEGPHEMPGRIYFVDEE